MTDEMIIRKTEICAETRRNASAEKKAWAAPRVILGELRNTVAKHSGVYETHYVSIDIS